MRTVENTGVEPVVIVIEPSLCLHALQYDNKDKDRNKHGITHFL